MGTFKRVVLMLLLCCMQSCKCQDSRITLNPVTLTLTSNTTDEGGSVTVRCEPPVSGANALLAMSILRVLDSNPNASPTALVSASLAENNGQPSDPSLAGASASGSMDERSITLSLSQARCADAGMYMCKVIYQQGDQFSTAMSDRNLTVDVTPGQLSMTVSPNNVLNWRVNQTLTMNCEGPVGNVDDNSQVVWVWEYRRADQLTFWSSYDGPNSDIQPGSSTGSTCNRRQTSILTRRLTLDDNDRIYRCWVQRRGAGFDQYAATHSVGSVTLTGSGPDSGTGNDDASRANVGPIVGGVLGSLIIIAIIFIIVYFLVLRPRRARKGDQDAQDKPDKLEEEENSAPAVIYSQPHRPHHRDKGGFTNKAMDESDDKDVPDDSKASHDNDDKQRGRRGRKHHKDPENNLDLNSAPRDPPRGHRYREEDEAELPPPYESRSDRPRRSRDDREREEGEGRGHRPPRPDKVRNHGTRNRGYDYDPRHGRSYSSDDGGIDGNSYYSDGVGDPSIGTAI